MIEGKRPTVSPQKKIWGKDIKVKRRAGKIAWDNRGLNQQ
ncbi:hypothetical protein CHK_3014 [Christensenella hongkongensis]|uniref:Uncharacterized protein n=1 Tax=Christensenella hongkongensis TaxID=270498 RepID=A0A0M2NEN6_9FIRM|nr:hypothetical protein CHK_3014 [Christensenella hongkongensis]